MVRIWLIWQLPRHNDHSSVKQCKLNTIYAAHTVGDYSNPTKFGALRGEIRCRSFNKSVHIYKKSVRSGESSVQFLRTFCLISKKICASLQKIRCISPANSVHISSKFGACRIYVIVCWMCTEFVKLACNNFFRSVHWFVNYTHNSVYNYLCFGGHFAFCSCI